MVAILYINKGERRMCGDVSMVFVPLFAPAIAKQAVTVRNATELETAVMKFWDENCQTDGSFAPSLRIEAGQGRKMSGWDNAKRYCYARVAMKTS